jgi:hypothetical protein
MMIPGVTVVMGGQDWTVPPLTLGQLRRLMPKVRQLTEIGAAMGEEQIAVLVDIVTEALRRNYPDITTDSVENLLDLGNASVVLNAVLTGSGLRSGGTPMGEAIAPGASPGAGRTNFGSVPVVVPETMITGAKSTVSSPPPAGIAIP